MNKDAYFFRALLVHVHFRECVHIFWGHVYFLPPSQSQVSLREACKDANFDKALLILVQISQCIRICWGHVYFLPPSQSQVSLREVLARKRNLTPTHSLNVCQPVGVEKMANNLYNVWLDIALVKTFLLIVSNWLVASLFPFFSSGNCYSGRSPLLLTSRYECATTIIIIIAIIIVIIYITVTIFFTLHHVTSWSGAQSS